MEGTEHVVTPGVRTGRPTSAPGDPQPADGRRGHRHRGHRMRHGRLRSGIRFGIGIGIAEWIVGDPEPDCRRPAERLDQPVRKPGPEPAEQQHRGEIRRSPGAVTVIDGAGAVKILDGGTLGPLDPAKHAGALPDPGAVLRRLEKLEPMAATLLPRSGQRHLYFGMLTGVLGRWHTGQALAYLRLADGPVCSPSQPMPSDGSPHLQQEVPCHVGVLAPLDDPTAEGVTIEGVY